MAFLTGSALTEAIRRVANGANLRCAVAFWGTGAARFLKEAGADLRKVKVLCDISMGATGPDALKELGAPDNDRLRRKDGLHAKVYVSESGLIVGSANASSNGIGFTEGGAVWLEAGSFHEQNSPEWHDATSWFGSLYRSALPVDDKGIEEAKAKFKPRAPYPDRPIREGSLLDIVRARPEEFGTIGFVFCDIPSTEEAREEAKAALRKSVPKGKYHEVDEMPDDGIYIGLKKNELRRWQPLYIEFFLSPKGRLTVSGWQVHFFEPHTGSVFSKRNWPAVRSQLPSHTPKATLISKLDAEIVAEIIKDTDSVVFFSSAKDLSEKLIELPTKSV